MWSIRQNSDKTELQSQARSDSSPFDESHADVAGQDKLRDPISGTLSEETLYASSLTLSWRSLPTNRPRQLIGVARAVKLCLTNTLQDLYKNSSPLEADQSNMLSSYNQSSRVANRTHQARILQDGILHLPIAK
jgi:hypothetical protein